jgi:hypothetical protein
MTFTGDTAFLPRTTNISGLSDYEVSEIGVIIPGRYTLELNRSKQRKIIKQFMIDIINVNPLECMMMIQSKLK